MTVSNVNLTHLTKLMLLYYLSKIKTLKFNTTMRYYQRKWHEMYHSFSKKYLGHMPLIFTVY